MMRRRSFIEWASVLIAAVMALSIASRASAEEKELSRLKANVAVAAAAIGTFKSLAAQASPATFTPAQKTKWDKQSAVFTARASAFQKLVDQATPLLAGPTGVAEMAKMNMQFLALQEATQMELKNVADGSTTRHDSAMASIKNIK